MNEKELQEIEQGLRSKIQEEWPTWEQIEQLIAEVKKNKKMLSDIKEQLDGHNDLEELVQSIEFIIG